MTNLGVKFRLTALALAVTTMGALIVLTTLSSQRQGKELRAQLNQIDSESFRIAENFKNTIRDVTDKMQRYRTSHDPVAWEEFRRASLELDVWIDDQKPKLKTQEEKDILQQIDDTYDNYRNLATDLNARVQALGSQDASLAEYSHLFTQSRRRLADLGQDLATAHFKSRNQLLWTANKNLTNLRRVLLGSLFLLFVFAVALGAMVYRDMIAPLRVKLVASQAQLERHEKLASLGMLAAGVAHEIRNPLTAIKAALFIQQKRFQPGTQEHEDAELVEREILRLERIVNDFLQFARPSEPQWAIIQAELPLREVQSLLTPQLAKDNIQLTVEESGPLKIRVDSAQIKQVLLNLVQNAADAIGHDGTIKLRARHDRKKLSDGETDVVVLEIADTGKGIPPEVETRLFDPFFTTKEVGTGLGLSIAARIVQKHGGALQYQTQVNHGTTFGIVLPQVTA